MVKYLQESTEYASTYTEEERLEYRLENITKPKIDFVIDQVYPELDGTDRWLDVGCATGGSVHHLQSPDWDAVGLEISDNSVTKAKERFDLDLEQQTIEEYAVDNPDGSFDVVSFSVALRHPNADVAVRDDQTVALGRRVHRRWRAELRVALHQGPRDVPE